MIPPSKATFTLIKDSVGAVDAVAMAKQVRDNVPSLVEDRDGIVALPGKPTIEYRGQRLVLAADWGQGALDIHLNGFIDDCVRIYTDDAEERATRTERRKREAAEREEEMHESIDTMVPFVCSTAAAVRQELIKKHAWSPGNGDVALLTALALMSAMRMRP